MALEKVVIVGSGPAGLSAAIYNARAGLSPLVVTGIPPGGQMMLTTEVENFPGYVSILGPKLIANMQEQARNFGTRFLNQNVQSVKGNEDAITLDLDNEKEIQAKSLLIATGANAKWLGLDSEKRLRGKGVSACATCDGFFFKDKIVAVVGGGDTAMEEANFLTRFAKKVFVIHRRDELRASKIMQKKVLGNKKVELIWNAEVEEILGDDTVTGLRLKRSEKSTSSKIKQKLPQTLDVDGVFIAIGHRPNTAFLQNSGVAMDPQGYIFTSARLAWEKARKAPFDLPAFGKFDMQYQYITSVSGVFAAGDVVDYLYRQASTAVGAGVAASLEIEKYLESV